MLLSDVIPVLSALITASCLVAMFLAGWFYSRFPIHVFELFYKWGWQRPDMHWPVDVISGDVWLRADWEDWVAGNLAPAESDLLRCPYCLSFHAAVWFSYLACFVFSAWIGFLGVFAGAYVLGLIIFKKLTP